MTEKLSRCGLGYRKITKDRSSCLVGGETTSAVEGIDRLDWAEVMILDQQSSYLVWRFSNPQSRPNNVGGVHP